MGVGRMIPSDQSTKRTCDQSTGRTAAPAVADAAAAGLTWRGGVPVSARFGDPYFSLAGGLAEARAVFLAGNALPDRLADGFHIAELGFGTGLNLIAVQIAWAATGRPGRLRYTTFEAYPMRPADMAAALAAFPEAAAAAGPMLAQWGAGATRLTLPGIAVEVVRGDARATLAAWKGRADAWFLDGFSPALNPQMWGADLMADVARRTVPGGTFATYTAAGHVRRALAAAGFAVERRPGFGTKRHMTAGRLPA